MYEVVLIDKNNKTEKHPFDNNLSGARKLLQESYTKQTHKEGELRKDGEVLMRFW